MKFLLSVTLLLTASFAQGQSKARLKADIETEVSRILKTSAGSTVSFRIQALKKVLHYINYEYFTENKKYVRIDRQYAHKNDTVRQSFYLKNDQLIYANETTVSYYMDQNKRDSIVRSGDFYFSNGKLMDYEISGHGRLETESWEPGQTILAAFNESKRDLSRFIKKKTGG